MKGTKICPVETMAWNNSNANFTREVEEWLVRKHARRSKRRERARQRERNGERTPAINSTACADYVFEATERETERRA